MAVLSIGQMWGADPAPAGTTLFSENFGSYSANDVPSGSVTTATGRVVYGGGSVIYTSTDNGTNKTMIYAANLASGTSPELLVGKSGGVFTIAGIPSGEAKEITVSFKQNAQKLTVSLSGTGYSTTYASPKPSAAGTISFDITVADGADATFSLIMTAGSSNVRVDDILVTVKTAGQGTTPAKTLQSVAVSGTPTKTSYESGENFDPAGLTVTGTYSDESTAPITSGITWSYDPSQELALNQTSIGVIATVNEIASPKFNVTGLTVSAAPAASNWQVIAPENLATGDVVVLTMLKNSIYYAAPNNGSGAPAATVVAVTNDKLSNTPAETLQWTVTVVAEGQYQFSVGTNYLKCSDTNNGVRVGAVGDDEYNTFDINTTNAKQYLHTTATMTSAANGRYLGIYNTQDWRCYTSVNNNIKEGTLVIFKEFDNRAATGLNFETEQYLIKKNATFSAPELINPNSLPVTYLSSNTDIAEVAANGAITIKADATGAATITASFAGDENYKDGSASYTIYVAEQAGTDTDPLTEESAKALIDLGCTKDVYVKGTVKLKNYYSTSKTYTITLTDDFQFYYFYAGANNATFDSDYLKIGDILTAYGTLGKHNTTYQINPCYMVDRIEYSEPLTDISNTKETAYTVAQAIALATNPQSDLTKAVYVRGVVYDAVYYSNSSTYNIFIKDANAENQFELYKCAGLYNEGTQTVDVLADGSIQEGNIVIGYGVMKYFGSIWELDADNYLVDIQVPITGVELSATAEVEVGSTVNLTATILPSNATGTIDWSVTSGSEYASVADGVVSGIAEGEAVIRATVHDTEIYAECTVTVTAAVAPDTRKIANGPEAFTTTSGDLNPADIAYASYQGGASTAPAIYNDGIRLYQIGGSNDFGGFVTITAKTGCTIDEVQITTTSKYATTVAYSVDGNENLLKSESVAASSSYTTGTGLNVSSVNILNVGTGSSGRLEIASIKVYYTGNALTIDHYELGGAYATEFEVGDDFNHNGLIVYAAYDALGENKVDITSACTFSTPDMSTEGQKTIDITYKEEVVKNYTITVNASTDSRKVAESPVTFTTVSGDMTPNDITFASYQGEAGTAPANYNDGIRLYQAPSADKIGGYITLKAKKGCTIDQVKITTTNSYATTVAYSVDGNENLLGSESVAKSSDYSTPSGLNVESVNIVNKGTGSSGRLEIASIKVWYTGDALAVHHYILGGTYATEFEQYGEFNFEGLTVTAAYDAEETITETITGFTVEADLSTAGAKKANVMLNSVKIAEYDITVTPSAKKDPALAYSPASVILTLGDALSAPTFSNTYNVSPITYSSGKPAVATVDAEGNITLAGGCGVAVITASFAGDDNYIESEATFTITVNEPAEDLSGTWVKATSVAAGDRIIVGATVAAGTKTMGLQNTNNRAAVASTYEDMVLTPTEGTKTFLVVDAGDGKFALQALNGKYLTSATSGTGNNLLEAANYENDNAKWTITIDGEGVASVVAAAGNRTYMKYNNGSTLFSCYQYETSQSPINIYKKGTPDYGSYQRDVTAGRYGTICLPKAGKLVSENVTLFEISYKESNDAVIYLDEVDPLAMEAGMPYIFFSNNAQINVEYTSGVESTAKDNNGLHGTLVHMDDMSGAGIYMISNNELIHSTNSASYLDANRAYIMLGEVSTTAQPKQSNRRRVAMGVQGEQTATGMDELNAAEAPVKVLINGQLFILRGENMFNVNGQLVK